MLNTFWTNGTSNLCLVYQLIIKPWSGWVWKHYNKALFPQVSLKMFNFFKINLIQRNIKPCSKRSRRCLLAVAVLEWWRVKSDWKDPVVVLKGLLGVLQWPLIIGEMTFLTSTRCFGELALDPDSKPNKTLDSVQWNRWILKVFLLNICL